MGPFSSNTATLFVEAAKIAQPFNWDHLKPYFAPADYRVLFQRERRLLGGFQAVVMYSNQLVALNNSKLKDKEKNAQLVKYFEETIKKVSDKTVLDSIGVTQSVLSGVYEDIRAAETYLEGIAAAGPLVNAVVVSMEANLDSISQDMPVLLANLDRKVEMDYADRRANFRTLTGLQVATMRGMGLLYRARRGDTSSLDTLLQDDPSVKEFIPSPDKATSKGMTSAEAMLTDRLSKLDTFIHQMDTEVALYRAKLRELQDLRVNIDGRLKIAHDAIIVWGQSHRNLGAGIPVPPLIDVGRIATETVNKVSPIPIP